MSLFLKALPLNSIALRGRPSLFCLCRVPKTIPIPKALSRIRTVSHVSASIQQSPPSVSETVTSNAKPPLVLNESLECVKRTDFCGDLSLNDVGKKVLLCGWVALHRVHGGLTFLNLRDHTGIVQVLSLHCSSLLLSLIHFKNAFLFCCYFFVLCYA